MIGISLSSRSSGMTARTAPGGLIEEALTHSVIGAFFEVYNTLGFGFLEDVYVLALERELRKREHRVTRQARVLVTYKGEPLASQRVDLLVDQKLVLEVNATYELHRAASRQLHNYLRASNLEVGLLLHFGPEPQFYRLISRNRIGRISTGSDECSRSLSC